MRTKTIMLAFLPLALALATHAQTLEVPEVNAEFRVDGNMDEPAWQKALVLELPYEVEPGDNTPAPVRTTCYVVSTPHALLVGFEAFDPNPSEIRAHYSDRDRLFRDDYVGFILDTFADRRRAYIFAVNPLGVQADGVRSETAGDEENYSFDFTWNAAGRITPSGYQVEIEIPFSALRFPAGNGAKKWGFGALRAYPRSVRRMLFSARLDRNNSCTLCQLPEIQGFASARPGRSLEVNPTFAAAQSQTREEVDQPTMSQPSRRGDGGLSLLWGITPNLSLAATLNPDFSQVEADAAQLSINRTFALFYPEKRPFFLEGADNFSTPMPVVYTRSLADPQWGLKLTGKEGRSTLGVLLVRDEITNLLLPGVQESSQTTLERPSDAAVFRYRYDLGQSSVLGAIVSNRQAAGYHNRVLGVDGMLRFSDADSLQFQVLRSQTRYPALADIEPSLQEKELEDSAWQLAANHSSRNWEGWVFLRNVGEGFRADLGFLPQVGMRGGEVGAQRILWGEEGGWYTRLAFGTEVNFWEDQHGQLLHRNAAVMVRYSGPLQSTVFLRATRFTEAWNGQQFSGKRLRVFSNVRFSGSLTSSLGLELGDAVDYSNSQLARLTRVSPGFTWNWGRHLYLQGDFVGERLEVARGELYRALVAELRSWYHFNVRSYLRLILQRTQVTYQPELYQDPPNRRSIRTNTQVLFAYKLNPQSLVFVGYSSNLRGDEHTAHVTVGRTLFLKLSYNWLV